MIVVASAPTRGLTMNIRLLINDVEERLRSLESLPRLPMAKTRTESR
jgi:hypothetical protein